MASSKQPKLTYRFHNPNSNEVLADFLIAMFVKINYHKLEEAILKEAKDKEELTIDLGIN